VTNRRHRLLLVLLLLHTILWYKPGYSAQAAGHDAGVFQGFVDRAVMQLRLSPSANRQLAPAGKATIRQVQYQGNYALILATVVQHRVPIGCQGVISIAARHSTHYRRWESSGYSFSESCVSQARPLSIEYQSAFFSDGVIYATFGRVAAAVFSVSIVARGRTIRAMTHSGTYLVLVACNTIHTVQALDRNGRILYSTTPPCSSH